MALIDLNEAGLAETAALLAPFKIRTTSHRADMGDAQAILAVPDAVIDAHGRVDILVNNAGVAVGGRFEEISTENFEWLFNINFWGVVRMTRAFLPMLKAAPEARLINISSIYGIIAPPEQSAYVAQ